MGLHVTTVRFHLDALCDEGAIARARISRGGVGRPRTGYIAVQDRLDYQSLAEILALELGDTAQTRRRRAQRAGRRWAARIAATPPRDSLVTQGVPETGESVDRRAAIVADVFERMGFAPELKGTAGGRQRAIRLHACPVRDLARDHPEVGCAMHLGLLQGLLARSPARAAMRAELEPFVEPELCIAKVIADD
jgi:predicted ArsR family transcriptional regulator